MDLFETLQQDMAYFANLFLSRKRTSYACLVTRSSAFEFAVSDRRRRPCKPNGLPLSLIVRLLIIEIR